MSPGYNFAPSAPYNFGSKSKTMVQVNLNELELQEFTGVVNPVQQCRATFPLFGAQGTKQLATVYFELEPGRELGRHIDSAEELLLVLEGELEAEVNGHLTSARTGDIILVPEREPHNLRNKGKTRARVLGVFGGANQIVAEFEQSWLPLHSNRVNTRDLMVS